MSVTGSFQLMKSLNRSLILNTIRLNGPISRAEIAKRTKLTPPTVTNLVAELLESKLVRESEIGVSKGGRKPILLTINWKSSYVIGLDVGGHRATAVLTDLNAEIEIQKMKSLPTKLTVDSLLQFLITMIDTLIEESGIPKKKVLGIGIGMHGIVNHSEGVGVFAPNFNLTNIPIKDVLQTQFSIPTFVENDARALTLGESWFGNGVGFENIICVNLGVGIGAGVILQNELFHGRNGIAGEIGHMIVDLHGSKCSCGSYGCLQTVAGGEVLKERVGKELTTGRRSIIQDKANMNGGTITGELIHQCAIEGDSLAIEVLAETGRLLGVGLTNMINFMNPDRIIVGGGMAKAKEFILNPLKDVVRSRALTSEARETDIVLSKLGDQGTVIGAVTLVLKSLYTHSY
ncbi:ROK family transcriptional regulator [Halalkalibacter kiskunsagensis]|uniref:ROK family transcriptional regulator n=1 Tax=Halalkalibacter kiskunsagensis TaxID=1548599 RepID=A0ABV6KFX6_9BACI